VATSLEKGPVLSPIDDMRIVTICIAYCEFRFCYCLPAAVVPTSTDASHDVQAVREVFGDIHALAM